MCSAREVLLSVNYAITKMQAVADLFLLSSDIKPVRSESLTGYVNSYPNCCELVTTHSKGLLLHMRHIDEYLQSRSKRWYELDLCVQEVCDLVVSLTETCSHSVYLLSLTMPNNISHVPGIVDTYKVKQARLCVDLCCQVLKQATPDQLTPKLLVHLCTQITNNLTILTDCCKSASEKCRDENYRDQFKLCIKSMTSSASCFLTSVQALKQNSSEQTRMRTISFATSLLSSVDAATAFATESQFCGRPGQFTTTTLGAKMSIQGACMSLVSSSIQLCKVVRDVAYGNTTSSYERIQQCMGATSHASSQLASAYSQHQPTDHQHSFTPDSDVG